MSLADIAIKLNTIKPTVDGTNFRCNSKLANPQNLVQLLTIESKKELRKAGFDDLDQADIQRLYAEILQATSPANIDYSEIKFNDTIPVTLDKLLFILNSANKNEYYLYDEVNDVAYQKPNDFVVQRVSTLIGKPAFSEWYRKNSRDCEVGYKPESPRFYTPGPDRKGFNTYISPTWRQGWAEPTSKKQAPKLFSEFMQALFPTKEDRLTSAAWLRDAAFGRAEPILVLSGGPGVGKNFFIEHLASSLVGNHNYRSATRGFNRSYFHANVRQCRLFFVDEMNLTHEVRETLKTYHNGKATIERKGIDAADPEPIHASFALANNYPQYIRLEYADRKFYVPEITEVPLRESLGQSKIDELLEALKNENFIRDLAGFLVTNFKPGRSSKFEKNAKFRSLCLNAYPNWFQRFINGCSENSTILSKKFNKGQRLKAEYLDLIRQVNHFETNFQEPLAEVTETEGGNWIAKSLRYKPELNGKHGDLGHPTTQEIAQ